MSNAVNSERKRGAFAASSNLATEDRRDGLENNNDEHHVDLVLIHIGLPSRNPSTVHNIDRAVYSCFSRKKGIINARMKAIKDDADQDQVAAVGNRNPRTINERWGVACTRVTAQHHPNKPARDVVPASAL